MQAYNVLDELRKDNKYQTLLTLDQHIGTLYPREIAAFQKAKVTYEEILNTGGSYHPDYKDAIKVLSQTKTLLYEKPEVKRYFELEREVQDELNDFLNELAHSVSTHVKAPNKLGIVQKGGSCHVR
ncbi:MAG: hypothetical protein C4537_06975 [Acholeplasma sp.]|jgi:cell fate (sporulation/competence/biofilm development) regulator YlbF (YheA/YmcA/DUF963 family)|nr:MAG: hypothetical protein C4537_06975 [Acholeplasma sp.]